MRPNKSRADRVIAFLNLLPIVDGPAAGQRFKVDPWMEAWVREIYEPESVDGRRIVQRAILSVARKNAKSYLVAGLLLAHLIGPESVVNGQVYSCACDREQASVIFHMCRKMIEMSPGLKRHLKVLASTKTITVMSSHLGCRGSVYRALSAESTTKHGLGPSFFVYDELGEARDDELWNTMIDGQQSVESPLAIAISTQNNDPTHPLTQMIDDGLKKVDPTVVCHLYAADEDCDILDEAQWLKANPALATWKRSDRIAAAAAEASRMPAKEANFRRRYLNQRVNAYSTFLSQAVWKACESKESEFTDGEAVYLGLDMSFRNDLTALSMVSADNGSRVKTWCWKPSDWVAEHTKRDGFRYDLMVKQKWLSECPGPIITPRSIAETIADICSQYQVRGLAYDRWGTRELMREFDDIGLLATDDEKNFGSGMRIVPWGQGWRDMSPAITAFEQAVLTGDLKHDGNPLLTFCVMNSLVISDASGNRKLDKGKSRFRIDAAVALAMALGLKAREAGTTFVPISPWENPDFKMQVI